MDLDEILPDLGDFGIYQKIILYLVLLPAVVPCGFHAYNQIFMSAKPDHWCRVPSLEKLNFSTDYIKNVSVPLDRENKFKGCAMYDVNYLDFNFWNEVPNKEVYCREGWVYDKSKYESTVVTEWNLVCKDDFYVTLALVLLGIGGLIGNYIFGYVQDSLGRRPAFFIYLLIESIFGIATAFAQSYPIWVVLRFGVGFTVPAILGTPYVLSVELVGPSKRSTCTILLNIAYSLGLVALAGVVYLIRDWRQLSLATSLPFLAFFFYWWVLPESPRWLLAKGRFDEAEKILEKMARINGKILPEGYMILLKKKYEEERKRNVEVEAEKQYGITDLFRFPNLRRKTIIITFIWFTNTAVYVGLSYYAPILGGDEFLNFFLAGIVELPTYVFLWPAMEKLGRRWTLCLSMMIGGIACLATVLSEKEPGYTLALYCIGKMGISCSFVALPLMASELYPTVVRGLGISFSSVIGQIGPIVIPVVNYLGEEWVVLPLLVMGGLLVIGGMTSLLLPETLRQHLPQTLQDGENFGKNHICGACSSSFYGSQRPSIVPPEKPHSTQV